MIRIGGVVLDSPRIVGVVDSIGVAIGAEKAGADLLEVRIDLLERGTEVVQFLDDVREASSLPIIATNRPIREGGAFKGSEDERMSILYVAMDHADAVDVELGALESRGGNTSLNMVIRKANKSLPKEDFLKKRFFESLREQEIPLIVSHHDFNRTPADGEIMKILNDARGIGGYEGVKTPSNTEAVSDSFVIPKIAVMANSLSDVLRLLRITIVSPKPLSTIAMGALGKHSRAIAPLYGSALTYGHVDGPKAPGQLSVSELKTALDMLKE